MHPAKHRTPQATVAALGRRFQFDTIDIRGRLILREREANATTPGVLTLAPLHAVFSNVTNDPARMSDSMPLKVSIDAVLMGSAPVHIEATMPLLSSDFRMRWRGRLGAMAVADLNPFLVNATGMNLQGGEMRSVAMAFNVVGGHARGTIEPRWVGLRVEFPGVARGDQGLLGGIRRGIKKFAANAFVIRDDNIDQPDRPALNGEVDYRWKATETLPAFIWHALRDPLLPLIKH